MELIKTRYTRIKINQPINIRIGEKWKIEENEKEENEKKDIADQKIPKDHDELIKNIISQFDIKVVATEHKVYIKKDFDYKVDYKVETESEKDDIYLPTLTALKIEGAFGKLLSLSDTLRIKVEKGSIVLLYSMNDVSDDSMAINRVRIIVDSEAKILEILYGKQKGYMICDIHTIVSDGGKVSYLTLDRTEGGYGCILQRKRFEVGEKAQISKGALWNGASKAIAIEEVILEGEGGEHLDSQLCVGKGNRYFENNYFINHIGKRSRGYLHVREILYDSSQINFLEDAKIDEQAWDSDSFIDGRAIVMSKDAKAYLIPSMQIDTNMVKAKHSASISRIGDEEIFYAMTRGLSEDEAKKLIVDGFCTDALSKFPDVIDKNVIPKILSLSP